MGKSKQFINIEPFFQENIKLGDVFATVCLFLRQVSSSGRKLENSSGKFVQGNFAQNMFCKPTHCVANTHYDKKITFEMLKNPEFVTKHICAFWVKLLENISA